MPEDSFPRGRLRSRLAFWREIGASEFVQRVICDGYFLPFVRIPVACSLANQPSAFAHYPFVSNTLSSLLSRGVVEECGQRDLHVVSPLGVVPKAQNKLRLILDLRYLNDHLASSKFCLEDLRCVPVLFEPGFELFTFDLKDGYYHIEIAPAHRKFLGFSWPLKGNWRFFYFTCLPFGLKTAPFIFTKVLRPLSTYWRSLGFRIFLYLDDCTGGAPPALAQGVSARAKADLQAGGLVVNEVKSCFEPKKEIKALGHVIDTTKNLFCVTPERISKMKERLSELLSSRDTVSVRLLAKFAGCIASCG